MPLVVVTPACSVWAASVGTLGGAAGRKGMVSVQYPTLAALVAVVLPVAAAVVCCASATTTPPPTPLLTVWSCRSVMVPSVPPLLL